MPEYIKVADQIQLVVPLKVKPSHHQTRHTLTNPSTGTVSYGHYDMEYILPKGDRVRLVANHDKKTVQLLLFTHEPELIKSLPGVRHSSLVADVISRLNSYRNRALHYQQPLSLHQKNKLEQANQGIVLLTPLLQLERSIPPFDYTEQEKLRQRVISIIEQCRNNNRMIADNPIVSEGALGQILYEAFKTAQNYVFNRGYSISYQDQFDFNNPLDKSNPFIVWDSELHQSNLDETLNVLCDYYQLSPIEELNNIPANRFAKILLVFQKLWQDGQEWMRSLEIKIKPTHKQETIIQTNGLSITKTTPYYSLRGLSQKGYESLNELAAEFISLPESHYSESSQEANFVLGSLPNCTWSIIDSDNKIIIRKNDRLLSVKYFVQEGKFYPLPDGQDLYHLSQLCKKHLHWPEWLQLKFKGLIANIPKFFKNFYSSFRYFIYSEQNNFSNHIHQDHKLEPIHQGKIKTDNFISDALKNAGFLQNGESLEEFIKQQLRHSDYVIAQANHTPSPLPYDNPFHRLLGVVRHIAGFFIDTSERNPSIGLLAMAAYFYGAGAVLAPNQLAALLNKLHLNGLIAGIEPTQKLAHFMSHGKKSEAISASATYWQGVVIGGNLDKFFINAIEVLKNDAGELAVVLCLALSLGYGMTRLIPNLQKEMGQFPYTTYAALGGKSGGAIYDTIMHPGEDWLLGTCKWLFKQVMNLSKITLSPFVEAYHYGYKKGF